jgi:hypothetical protein
MSGSRGTGTRWSAGPRRSFRSKAPPGSPAIR